jgi:hypothetical protein
MLVKRWFFGREPRKSVAILAAFEQKRRPAALHLVVGDVTGSVSQRYETAIAHFKFAESALLARISRGNAAVREIPKPRSLPSVVVGIIRPEIGIVIDAGVMLHRVDAVVGLIHLGLAQPAGRF